MNARDGATTDQDILEQIIDRRGLAETLELLAAVCMEKGEHVRSNWQDGPLGHAWERNAGKLLRIKVDPTE